MYNESLKKRKTNEFRKEYKRKNETFMRRRRNRILGVVAGMFIILFTACCVYVDDYYRADLDAIGAFEAEDGVPMSIEIRDDNKTVYAPENANAGLIFYPGGKVEYTAYEPLMAACASEEILTVLVEMPFNLAVLDVDAAEGIAEQYPQIEHWYLGGHSLGGSMAAAYLSDHAEEFEGLVLLGSYSTADLSDTSLEVLSVYGSEDHVLNREKYEKNKDNLPDDFTEIQIEGGCHAYFGMYGPQEGDGIPTISNKEQIERTVEEIIDFVID